MIPGTNIPKPTVLLLEEDGNAFSIIACVQKALRRAGASDKTVKAFSQEARSGDYNHLLQTVMKYVDVGDSDEN